MFGGVHVAAAVGLDSSGKPHNGLPFSVQNDFAVILNAASVDAVGAHAVSGDDLSGLADRNASVVHKGRDRLGRGRRRIGNVHGSFDHVARFDISEAALVDVGFVGCAHGQGIPFPGLDRDAVFYGNHGFL